MTRIFSKPHFLSLTKSIHNLMLPIDKSCLLSPQGFLSSIACHVSFIGFSFIICYNHMIFFITLKWALPSLHLCHTSKHFLSKFWLNQVSSSICWESDLELWPLQAPLLVCTDHIWFKIMWLCTSIAHHCTNFTKHNLTRKMPLNVIYYHIFNLENYYNCAYRSENLFLKMQCD